MAAKRWESTKGREERKRSRRVEAAECPEAGSSWPHMASKAAVQPHGPPGTASLPPQQKPPVAQGTVAHSAVAAESPPIWVGRRQGKPADMAREH